MVNVYWYNHEEGLLTPNNVGIDLTYKDEKPDSGGWYGFYDPQLKIILLHQCYCKGPWTIFSTLFHEYVHHLCNYGNTRFYNQTYIIWDKLTILIDNILSTLKDKLFKKQKEPL